MENQLALPMRSCVALSASVLECGNDMARLLWWASEVFLEATLLKLFFTGLSYNTSREHPCARPATLLVGLALEWASHFSKVLWAIAVLKSFSFILCFSKLFFKSFKYRDDSTLWEGRALNHMLKKACFSLLFICFFLFLYIFFSMML